MIKLENVSFSYANGDTDGQFHHLNLSIPTGQVVLICGESGCGKTTITRMINGLIPNYYEGELEGKIVINDINISDKPLYETAKQVGSVFQNPRSQFYCMDTTSELAFGCENQGIEEETIIKRINRTVEKFNLERLMNRNIFALSGGEKQKISCASVDTVMPNICVLDEPSSNLDMKSIRDLRNVILTWKKERKTVVISEHRLYYLLDIVDRVIVMEKGSILNDLDIESFTQLPIKTLRKLGLRSFHINDLEFNNRRFRNNLQMEIIDFKFNYGAKEVLNIPYLSVPQGCIAAIIGNNGAGKTTFSRCLCGLERKMQGILRYCNKVYSAKERLSISYMVMQDVNHQLFTEDVVSEVLLSMDEECEQKTEEILQGLNLLEFKDRHPMSLSGGQKQRVAIGSALASEKQFIIYDEPSSGLDYRHMREVAENIKSLEDKNMTQFIVTHDPELINQCCNYYIFIENGKVAWSGESNEQNNQRLKMFFSTNQESFIGS